VTHPEKQAGLIEAFRNSGWDTSRPNLLGYTWEDRIQLATGSHRWDAANETGILVPVNVYTYDFMREIWGTDEWVRLIKKHT
jgi:ParB-like chromosome segregation protein Spo0J